MGASSDGAPPAPTFEALGLDARVRRAATKRGFEAPTAVQAAVCRALLSGRDCVAVARTGSGKTAAYLLPVLHQLLSRHAAGDAGAAAPPAGTAPRAVVLVPTTELVAQVRAEAKLLCGAAGGAVAAGVLPPPSAPAAALRAACAAAPDLLVCTPARLAGALAQGLLPGFAPEALVLDEADLLLSYGYEVDLRTVAERTPRRAQRLLCSATGGPAIAELQALVLHNPEVLNLEGSARDGATDASSSHEPPAEALPSTIEHFVMRVPAKDKLLAVMALLRLGAVRRKSIVFVDGPDASVRLRLFMERFGVQSAAAHCELPVTAREHLLQQFNRGIFDHLVATDLDAPSRRPQPKPEPLPGLLQRKKMKKEREAYLQREAEKRASKGKEPAGAAGSDGDGDDALGPALEALEGGGAAGNNGPPSGSRSKRERDGEFGVVRGVDFQDVRTVINLAPPASAEQYVHRVGRTGRAGKTGVAVTLVAPEEEGALAALREAVAARVGDGFTLAPFKRLRSDALNGLRYRAEDVMRSIGRNAVREARDQEIKRELLNSERLKEFFEANPEQKAALQSHAGPLGKRPSAPHLKHLPAYVKGAKAVASQMGASARKSGQGGGLRATKAAHMAAAAFAASHADGTVEEGDGDPLKLLSGAGDRRKRAADAAAASWVKPRKNVRANKRKRSR